MIDLSGKSAVITGGSRGIGASASVMFAQAGADVAINYNRNSKAAQDVKRKVEKIGRKCTVIQADFSKKNEIDRFIDSSLKELGKIDILVNNHGIWNDGHILDMTEETWDELLNINLKSFFLLCQRVIPIMKSLGGGRIINVTSTAGQRGEAEHSHYAASKGGIISFTKSLSSELARDNILVNGVAPGWVNTEMNTEVFSDKKRYKEIIEGIPLKRMPPPEDIAGPILFLASELANHITGEIINVNGGAVLCG